MKTKAPFSTLKGYTRRFNTEWPTQEGFEIGLQVILGNFAFQKMAMVKDLEERANELPAHDVIAAIAGDSEAKSAMSAEQSDPDPKEFDRIPPDNEFLVLDTDSSQQRAIAAVMANQSRVIHGPPGTGKSRPLHEPCILFQGGILITACRDLFQIDRQKVGNRTAGLILIYVAAFMRQ